MTAPPAPRSLLDLLCGCDAMVLLEQDAGRFQSFIACVQRRDAPGLAVVFDPVTPDAWAGRIALLFNSAAEWDALDTDVRTALRRADAERAARRGA